MPSKPSILSPNQTFNFTTLNIKRGIISLKSKRLNFCDFWYYFVKNYVIQNINRNFWWFKTKDFIKIFATAIKDAKSDYERQIIHSLLEKLKQIGK